MKYPYTPCQPDHQPTCDRCTAISHSTSSSRLSCPHATIYKANCRTLTCPPRRYVHLGQQGPRMVTVTTSTATRRATVTPTIWHPSCCLCHRQLQPPPPQATTPPLNQDHLSSPLQRRSTPMPLLRLRRCPFAATKDFTHYDLHRRASIQLRRLSTTVNHSTNKMMTRNRFATPSPSPSYDCFTGPPTHSPAARRKPPTHGAV